MKRKLNILIADRNPNVREFLKRELLMENFRVICAEDAKTMFRLAFEPLRVDVLILDPDLPGMEPPDVLEKLKIRFPTLPVIIHCLSEESLEPHLMPPGIFIEKGGESIETIKRVLKEDILEGIV